MKLNVGQIQGLSGNSFNVTIPDNTALEFNGSSLRILNPATGSFPCPNGTAAQWDANEREKQHKPYINGQLRFNADTGGLQCYYNGQWMVATTDSSNPGDSESNPATDGNAIAAAGLTSGLYWIQPNNGVTAYEMYVDTTRNGGGWVLVARVTTSSCQAHMTTSAVGISGTTGPRLTNNSTTKMSDSWINALRSASSYSGSTRWWLEADGWNKNMFVDSNATMDGLSSASNQNERTRVSTTFEGSISDRGPNTGTRGFGDHHTSGGTYFAWGRHPEQNNNCGFRADSLGSSNGYLWIK